MPNRPILVTGTHRSGTTWVANVLALARDTCLVGREPFNSGPHQWGLGGLAAVDYAHVPDLGDDDGVKRRFARVLAGRVPVLVGRQGRHQLRWLSPFARPRVIVKDPLAAFSAPWLCDHFALDVVVVLRHPGGFAASLRRMGWTFDWSNLLAQPQLLDGPLHDLADRIREEPTDPVVQAGLLWRAVYTVLLDEAAQRPDWTVVRHEDLSSSPRAHYQTLFDRLGLGWDATVEQSLGRLTSAENRVSARAGQVHDLRRDSSALVDAWREQLSDAEVVAVTEAAGPLLEQHYGAADSTPGEHGP